MSEPSFKKTESGWLVIDEARGVWSLEYEFASGGFANCIAVRLPDGGLLILSPACGASPEALSELEQLGPVRALVATNGFHHLGLKAWRERFPEAHCYAPAEAFSRIAKKNPEAGPLEPLRKLEPLLGDGIVLREVPNTKCGEMWAIIKSTSGSQGSIIFVSDILANIPALPSKLLLRLMFKFSKSAPGYRVFNLALTFIVKDKKAVLGKLLEDLKAFPPAVILPAHGPPVAGGDVAARTHALLRTALA